MIAPLLLIVALSSQPPVPSPGTRQGSQPHQQTSGTQQQPAPDIRGTDQAPLRIQILPTTKTKEETTKEQYDREEQASAQRWMKGSVVVMTLIGMLQLIVFGLQAYWLRQTIETMERIAKDQTADMLASIAEAGKSAKAMEGIAAALATNVEQLRETLTINKRIAEINETAMLVLHQQAIELTDWTHRLLGQSGSKEEAVWIHFRIRNPSAMRFTVTRVTVGLVDGIGKPSALDCRVTVPPQQSWRSAGLICPLSPVTRSLYDKGVLPIPMQIAIDFVDAFKQPQRDEFLMVCEVGPGKTVSELLIYGPEKVDNAEQDEQQGQPKDQPQPNEPGLS